MIIGGVFFYIVDWVYGVIGFILDNLFVGIYNYNVIVQGCGQVGSVNLEVFLQLDVVVDFMLGNFDFQVLVYVFGGILFYIY